MSKSVLKNRKPSLNAFDLTQLAHFDYQCVQRAADTQSRQLFKFECDGQGYWLKTQQFCSQVENQWREQGFQREIDLYQNSADAACILPSQYIQLPLGFLDLKYPSQALILPDAKPLFVGVADIQGDIDDIKHRIFMALHALQALHERGWIHADLKRAHFVEYQHRGYLLDFEQVQRPDQKNQDLHATPRYMAPELFQGSSKSIQTDLYALGIVLLEWLSGEKLAAKTYDQWAVLHCQNLNIDLSAPFQGFSKLLQGLLAKRAEARFADIYAVKRFLMTEIE